MQKIILIPAVALALAGCAGKGLHEIVAGDPQANAGITTATIEQKPDGSFKGTITDGKNRGTSNLDMTMKNGTVIRFNSDQVDASTAQAQQAAASVEATKSAVEAVKMVVEKLPNTP